MSLTALAEPRTGPYFPSKKDLAAGAAFFARIQRANASWPVPFTLTRNAWVLIVPPNEP